MPIVNQSDDFYLDRQINQNLDESSTYSKNDLHKDYDFKEKINPQRNPNSRKANSYKEEPLDVEPLDLKVNSKKWEPPQPSLNSENEVEDPW